MYTDLHTLSLHDALPIYRGFKDISFPAPVSIGDTLRAETEVLSKRESKSRPNAGIVEFEPRGYTQKDTLIARLHRIALMMKVPVGGCARTRPDAAPRRHPRRHPDNAGTGPVRPPGSVEEQGGRKGSG